MTPILALDLGTRTGFAWRTGDGCVYSGFRDLASAKMLREHKKSGLRAMRCADPRFCALAEFIRSAVTNLRLGRGNPEVRVIFEDVQFSSSTAQTQLWASLRAAVWGAACADPDVSVETVQVGPLKKFATGFGNAKKEHMIVALHRKFPHLVQVVDDNEVDARWLLEYAILHEPK